MLKTKIALCITMLIILFSANVHASENGYIVKFKNDVSVPCELLNQLKEINKTREIYVADNKEILKKHNDIIEYIEKNSSVELIDAIDEINLMALPDDELYFEQWQLQMINADSFWKTETYGNDVKVAVIDTGCYAHEDLKENLLPGRNYYANNNDANDDNGHGTHVSGIIAAQMNDFGTTGIAPKAKIIPLKCFNSRGGGATVDMVIDAIYDAVDLYDCDIINMSFGIKEKAINLAFEEAINYAYDNNVILVAAVGNDGITDLAYPAAYENVIGVGSVEMDKTKSDFSRHNNSVFAVAAGRSVTSTFITETDNGYYRKLSGTSQASPMVAGLAAVALSMNPDLTNTEFAELLKNTSEDLGASGWDENFGYGLVNGDAIANKLMADVPCYTSPINHENNISYVYIKNNLDTPITATSIFTEYEQDKFISFEERSITLLPKKEIIIKTYARNATLRHMLWNDFNNIKPYSIKR